MKPLPVDWPRISSCLFYADPRAAIDWLCRAFGFSVRLLVEGEGGRIEHSELDFGDGLIMVGGAGPAYASADKPWRAPMASPRQVDGRNTQNLCVHVDDVDAHCAHARAAGARIVVEPATHDYGGDYWSDRTYGAMDPDGHLWWFVQRISTRGVPHGG
jgi:uncharacterized glyoxalase superfamily protein PhnB